MVEQKHQYDFLYLMETLYNIQYYPAGIMT